ncbi:MAG: hypothetical protein ACREJB_01305, partial [Planctomycetaceae bacterium]
MLDRMKHHAWYVVEQGGAEGDNVLFGRISLGFGTAPAQPFASDDGSWAVLDGELYDAEDARGPLERQGLRFTGESHAEILLRGCLSDGAAFLGRTRGKFAAAIWDGPRRRLLLVNDRFGMRPLYYAQTEDGLLFASEIKALLTNPAVSRARNLRGIAQFFPFGHLWNADTFYESVSPLPAAAWAA